MSYRQPGEPRRFARRPEAEFGPSRLQPAELGSYAVIAVCATLAVLAMVALIVIGRSEPPEVTNTWTAPLPALPPLAQEPIPILSGPPSSAAAPPITSRTVRATGNPLPVARRSSPTPAASSSPTPQALLPALGTRISIIASGDDGLFLRHRAAEMLLSPVGPRSNASDKADATFLLRPGLADRNCYSLESVNATGQFVRHQNFTLYLQPRDPSPLFAADATFCPQRTGTSTWFAFRAVNFPDCYLTADGPYLRLSRVPLKSAQAFRAVPGF